MEASLAAREDRKVAFVTGASSGIGRAVAESFVGRGYATVLVDRDADLGRRLEAQLRLSGECMFVPCDVADDPSVRDAVEQAVKAYGRLDAAFNGAGVAGEQGVAMASSSLEDWRRLLAVNLTGVWSCMRYQIPQMLRTGGGSIVNCASAAGLVGVPYMAAYSATKHGVVGLTKSAALEYARQGVRVNAVCPGATDTPMLQMGSDPERQEMIREGCPMGRLGRPMEIADAVLWLCDERSGFVTGQAIALDGGLTAG
jgi:NAD(P)-dependent dehydrogenase (short-subunit alcohol dehydrogenase family)